MADLLKISEADSDGRFSRFKLIEWWEQDRLSQAKVLVIGAGALGNEIVKNLALLGVGNVLIADFDTIESSNLSRSVLFREEDCGQSKAEVAARRAVEIYPEQSIAAFHGNVVYDLGLGVYRWADVILGGLDNREARVAINRAAARTGKVWIDGAIERLQGVARVFDPACGPCYECTMNEIDWKMLDARRSCALLTRDEMQDGKVPTTPTTSSIIAGVQCQEAVKMIHGMDVLSGRGYVFDGVSHQSYVVTYSQKEECPAHDPYNPIESLSASVNAMRVGDFLERVRGDLGRDAVIETNHDLLASLTCANCQKEEELYASLGQVSERQGRCPRCGEHRSPNVYHTIDGQRSLTDRTLSEIGVPRWDILCGRQGLEQRYYEFTGDSEPLLRPMRPAPR